MAAQKLQQPFSQREFDSLVDAYDSRYYHYNLISEYIYRKHLCNQGNPLGYLADIVSGLIVFDMGRVMGPADQRFTNEGFLGELRTTVEENQEPIKSLASQSLLTIDLEQHQKGIQKLFEAFKTSHAWRRGVTADGRPICVNSPVGASKVLHWLCPEVFLIVDSKSKKVLAGSSYVVQLQSAKNLCKNLQIQQKPIARAIDKALFSKAAKL